MIAPLAQERMRIHFIHSLIGGNKMIPNCRGEKAFTSYFEQKSNSYYIRCISSAEYQRGVNAVERCSIENQKGVIAIDLLSKQKKSE